MSEKDNFDEKVKNASEIVKKAIEKYPNIAVACSFGKDSMVVVDLARKVDPNIKIFSIMTKYKPTETFEYLVKMDKEMNLGLAVFLVADEVPQILQDNNIKVTLLSPEEFNETSAKVKKETGREIYEETPDECCRLLKVIPTKEAVKNYDSWICGLRNTEGRTREDYKEFEERGQGLMKVNPILAFTEKDVLRYIEENKIPLHPWYTQEFPDGRKYRSLGCATCTVPIYSHQLERDGRWKDTSKCGGECGIHTLPLK